MEGDGHLGGNGLASGVRALAAAGAGDERSRSGLADRRAAATAGDRGSAAAAITRAASASQASLSAFQASRSAVSRVRPPPGRPARVGCRQHLRERIEVVADPDPALGRSLDGDGAATREQIDPRVAGPAVAGDERMHEGRREAVYVVTRRVLLRGTRPTTRFDAAHELVHVVIHPIRTG